MTHTNTNQEPRPRPNHYGTPGAFVRRTTTARTTGTPVRILDLQHPEASSLFKASQLEAAERWAVACEHDLYTLHGNISQASIAATNPECFCPQCELVAEARGYFTEDL